MVRWFQVAALFTPVYFASGCLPPVQESDTPMVSSETAEKSAEESMEQTKTASDAGTAAASGTSADDSDFQTTSSGLKYKIVKPGSDNKPSPSDTVECHYKGWLDNGNVFDSSYDRGEPAQFPLNGVIAGWTEGLQLIGEEGEIELIIPSDLGYGKRGAGEDIPPDSTLHFKVELLKVL